MITIGIDINEANVNRRVGVSEFAYELLQKFSKQQSDDLRFQLYAKDQPTIDFPQATAYWKYQVFGPKKMWTQFALPAHLFLQAQKSDVFFSPSHYAPRFSPSPTVISIMDVAYRHFPHLFAKKDLYQLENWTKYSVKNAKKIITISQASKSDILKEYGISDDKVVVVYPGIKQELSIDERKLSMENLDPHIYQFEEIKRKFKLKDKFLLFVSTLQPRKNVTRLIEAFSMLKETKADELQLVIVGKKGWLYEEILAAPAKYHVEKEVLFLDFVNNDELVTLYKNAETLVFPSLYEGFGLTVLEAMKYGCPVITSNVSSLPEAGGDAAIYVDPLDVQDITKKIEKVLFDGSLRKDMIAKGHKQVQKFSWDKAAKETLAVLQEVGGK